MTAKQYNFTKQNDVVMKARKRFTKQNGVVKQILAGWTKRNGVVEQVYEYPYNTDSIVQMESPSVVYAATKDTLFSLDDYGNIAPYSGYREGNLVKGENIIEYGTTPFLCFSFPDQSFLAKGYTPAGLDVAEVSIETLDAVVVANYSLGTQGRPYGTLKTSPNTYATVSSTTDTISGYTKVVNFNTVQSLGESYILGTLGARVKFLTLNNYYSVGSFVSSTWNGGALVSYNPQTETYTTFAIPHAGSGNVAECSAPYTPNGQDAMFVVRDTNKYYSIAKFNPITESREFFVLDDWETNSNITRFAIGAYAGLFYVVKMTKNSASATMEVYNISGQLVRSLDFDLTYGVPRSITFDDYYGPTTSINSGRYATLTYKPTGGDPYEVVLVFDLAKL